jgi:hypothetical protein
MKILQGFIVQLRRPDINALVSEIPRHNRQLLGLIIVAVQVDGDFGEQWSMHKELLIYAASAADVIQPQSG